MISFPPDVTCEQLESAQELLQAGHDYIESFGFDISTYAGPNGNRDFGAPRCYIGTVRGVAGLRPGPKHDCTDSGLPELNIALRLLDHTVLEESREKLDVELISVVNFEPGRVAEAVGLAMTRDQQWDYEDGSWMQNWSEQTEMALTAFRQALTEVYYKLEDLRGGHEVVLEAGEEESDLSEQKELSLVG